MMLKSRSAVPLVFSCLLALTLPGQTAPTPTATEPPRFEVASIHRNTWTVIRWRAMFTPDGFAAEDTTLAYILQMAYGFSPRQQWAKGPDWIYTARFNIEAKSDPGLYPHPAEEQRKEMLRGLLEQRFRVVLHHETRDYPMYVLNVAKGGPKFREATPEEVHRSPVGGAALCYFAAGAQGYANMQGCTIADLAMRLSGKVSPTESRIVVDRTGLTGRYDLELRWNAAELSASPAESVADTDNGSPELTTVVREQLGLVLVPTHGPLDTIVIDHVEMPTEN